MMILLFSMEDILYIYLLGCAFSLILTLSIYLLNYFSFGPFTKSNYRKIGIFVGNFGGLDTNPLPNKSHILDILLSWISVVPSFITLVKQIANTVKAYQRPREIKNEVYKFSNFDLTVEEILLSQFKMANFVQGKFIKEEDIRNEENRLKLRNIFFDSNKLIELCKSNSIYQDHNT